MNSNLSVVLASLTWNARVPVGLYVAMSIILMVDFPILILSNLG